MRGMDDTASLIRLGTETLVEAGIHEPRRETSALLAFALERDGTFVIAHPEYVPERAERERFLSLISRRKFHEPFHYLTGVKEFYGLDFKVSPAVLIPRPETEMLVEKSLAFLSEFDEPRFCEVGVGSGCISVAILANLGRSSAVGLELSRAAIGIAEENAAAHRVGDRFDLRESDLFSAIEASEKFDLIVSNPPYIPAAEFDRLETDVKDFEPRHALTDNADGLSIISRLIAESPQYLRPAGRLSMEIGFGQAPAVMDLFKRGPWTKIAAEADFQNILRTISAEREN